MDSQDHHNKNGSSGHENHECHKCGWPFPNPHPSAKQRRAHKKVCGTIEGYKPIESNAEHSPLAISDDDAASDDDQRTPSPKIEKTSLKELGSGSGVAEMSTKSEDEVFSDAVMEFSESGVSPGMDERIGELNKDVEKLVTTDLNGRQFLKVDTTADPSGQPNDPAQSSQMCEPEVVESAKDQSETAKSLNDSVVEKSSVESSREIGLQFESSPVKFETPTDVLVKEIDADVDRRTEQDVEKDKSLTDSIDPHVKDVRELSKQESCSEEAGERTLSALTQESVIPEADRETESELEASTGKFLDFVTPENVVHEPVSMDYKLPMGDGQTSDLSTDGIIEHKKDENDELEANVAKNDVSPLVKPAEDMEDSAVVFTHAIDGGGQSKMVGFNDLREEGKEDLQTSSLKKEQEETKVSDVQECNPSEVRMDRIIEQKKDENDGLEGNVANNDVSPLVEPVEQMEDCAADFAHDIDGSGESKMVGTYGWRDEGKEDLQSSNSKKEQEETRTVGLNEQKEEDTVFCNLSEAQKDHGHSFSDPKSLPVTDNAEHMIEDFKDHNTLKSSLPLDLGSAEAIRLVQGDDMASIVEEGHSGLHPGDLSRSIESSSADLNDLEHDLNEKSVEKHPEGNSELIKESDEDRSPRGLEAPSDAPRTEAQNTQSSNISEGLHLHPIDNEPSQKAHSENATMDQSGTKSGIFSKVIMQTTNLSEGENGDNNEMNNSAKSVVTMDQSDIKSGVFGEEIMQTANFIEVENADNSEMNNSVESVAATKESSREPLEDDFSANKKTIQEIADSSFTSDDDQTNSSLKVDQNQHYERATAELLDTARCESTKVVDWEILLTNTEAADESAGQTAKSTASDVVPEKVINARGNMEQTYSSVDRCADENSQEAPQGFGFGNITAESVGSASKDIEVNRDGILLASDENPEDSIFKEVVPLHLDYEFLNKSPATVEGSHATEAMKNSSDCSSEPLRGEVGNKLDNQHDSASAIDISFASSSQADSLEGNWGSVSVVSTQSDTTASAEAGVLPFTQPPEKSEAYVQMPKHATDERHPDKSDVFEPPSFMTLVESGSGVSQKAAPSEIETARNNQQPKPEDLQAGWFPSLSNVVNESQGRKKNEEIIAKVSNWSAGKQHAPLKSLLGEAQSPNSKQVPTVIHSDATATKSDGAAVTTLNATQHSEAPKDQAANKEMEKEWNSPARYPSEIKREKRKGKPYWVPFVCCSSVH